jgi:hypothetical protein
MSYPRNSNDPPSYDDIISDKESSRYPPSEKSPSAFTPSTSTGGGQGLVDTLTSVRAKHIRSVVDSEIYPLISDRASQGLSKSTFALIPSNVVSETSPHDLGCTQESQGPEIIGLANDDDEDVSEIRLQGNLNRFEFWRQPDVVKELALVLRDRLSSSSRLLDELLPPPPPTPPEPRHVPTPEPSKARSFLGRSKASSSSSVSKQNVVAPQPVVMQEERRSNVDVKVDLEEICLRTMSDFGLYETISRPVVIVRVDARC